jgi:hypothetical protein
MLASIVPLFLIGELLLGNLSETVIVHGMRRMIARASSCVIWSATVRVSSARKRQWAGSQANFLIISLS